MPTNTLEYKNDGVYYNTELLGQRGKTVRLRNQTIDTGIGIGDVVEYDNANSKWIKISHKENAVGVYEGNDAVVVFGECILSGLSLGVYYAKDDASLTKNKTSIKIGTAISSTQLLVDIDSDGNNPSYYGNTVTKLLGGTGIDRYRDICVGGEYIYAVGYTYSEGHGSVDTLIVKYDKNLNLIDKKIYGGINDETLASICYDGTYLYAVGNTTSEGQGDYEALIIKYDKDLNIVSKKIYGGVNMEVFRGVAVSGAYVYVVGDTRSAGQGGSDALLIKYDKDLNVIASKTYGVPVGATSGYEYYEGIFVDGSDIFVAGWTNSEGEGEDDGLVAKYDTDLNLLAKKVYGGTDIDYFRTVSADSSNVFLAGRTLSEGQGGYDSLIVKLDKDLNFVASKICGSSNWDEFRKICLDGDYIYVADNSDGDGLLVKFDKNLVTISAKTFGNTGGSDRFYSIALDSNHVYAVGESDTVGGAGQGDDDAFIVKLEKSMPAGAFSSTPSGFSYQDAAVTFATPSTLVLNNSAMTEGTPTLTEADSELSHQDSFLKESGPFITN